MSAIRMDMRCVSSGPLKTDSSAALRVSVLPDLDVTGEFCTRENVIETGTRGAEARHGRAQCEADRRPPATDRSRIWLATRKLARYRLPGDLLFAICGACGTERKCRQCRQDLL